MGVSTLARYTKNRFSFFLEVRFFRRKPIRDEALLFDAKTFSKTSDRVKPPDDPRLNPKQQRIADVTCLNAPLRV